MAQITESNTDDIISALQSSLSHRMTRLLQGAEADLNVYARQIASDLVLVMREADPEVRHRLLTELQAQSLAIAETHRLRATSEGMALIQDVIEHTTNVAIAVIAAA